MDVHIKEQKRFWLRHSLTDYLHKEKKTTTGKVQNKKQTFGRFQLIVIAVEPCGTFDGSIRSLRTVITWLATPTCRVQLWAGAHIDAAVIAWGREIKKFTLKGQVMRTYLLKQE